MSKALHLGKRKKTVRSCGDSLLTQELSLQTVVTILSQPKLVGQGSEQSHLVEDVPAHCRGLGLDDL